MHRLEHRHVDRHYSTYRARPRGVRRRVAARIDRHLRLRRRGWFPACFRSTLTRALYNPLRDARTKGVSTRFTERELAATVFATLAHRIQPQRRQLHVDIPHGWQ